MRRPQTAQRSGGLAPLRRKPKTLDAPPVLRRATDSGAAVAGREGAPERPGRDGTAPGLTTERGRLIAAPVEPDTDPLVLRRARQIAARLALPRPPRRTIARRGAGELVSVPWRGSGDDLDLDRTLEQVLAMPQPRDEDFVVREFIRPRRAVVLLVDVSGSMRGERVRTAAATVGALAGEFVRDALAVVAFAADAMLLTGLTDHLAPGRLLDTMVRIPAKGLTNVAFPLQVARDQLASSPLREARVLLLSDCVHNAGPDPRPEAARLPRVDVLLDCSDEHDLDLARDLARLGRGRLAVIRDHRQVAPAISRFFAD
ncbi:MAG TPA: vWA domain-containing protein [Sporichthyaceae bacterium]